MTMIINVSSLARCLAIEPARVPCRWLFARRRRRLPFGARVQLGGLVSLSLSLSLVLLLSIFRSALILSSGGGGGYVLNISARVGSSLESAAAAVAKPEASYCEQPAGQKFKLMAIRESTGRPVSQPASQPASRQTN